MLDSTSFDTDLTFYHQKRLDGGVRTGIMLGENTVLGRFDEGTEDYNPALIWSVDLRCNGLGLPSTADEARQWLIAHEGVIREGFRRFADELTSGSDPTGAYLLEWNRFPDPPQGVEMKIVCGAMRRVDARNLASVLLDVAANWRELLSSLSLTEPELI
jgi:hypothetical protein